MRAVKKYTREYVDACQERISRQINAYHILVRTAREQSGPGNRPVQAALEGFNADFFNNLLILLDAFFIHRTRDPEGKGTNPLNEVSLLADSLLTHGGKLAVDRPARWDPAGTVLKYEIGERIRLDEASFLALSGAFFRELEKKFL